MQIEVLYKYLKTNQITDLDILVSCLSISESTIRRRLKVMEEVGLLNLERGGKIKLISEPNISVSDEFRKEQNRVNKIRIAKLAASYVEDDDVIFIDNGTTVRNMLKYLQANNVTIYTNGYQHIDLAKAQKVEIQLIPGSVLATEASIVGESALIYLSQINLDKAFIGANGYDCQNGITTPNLSEANLKRHALNLAHEAYILIDPSKHGLVSKYKICEFSEFIIID